MIDFRADMHCHSTCSDGLLTPKELILKAKQLGLAALSITDHDTVDAYTEELFEFAKEQEIILCPGVEFSCQLMGSNVHVLAYNFDIKNHELTRLCQRHQNRRKERNRKILRKLRNQGFLIEDEELEKHQEVGVIGRPHIASLMIKKGFVSSIKEAFNKFLGDGKSCFDAGECFSIEETLKIIKGASGKSFIAHPHLVKKGKLIKEVLKRPFDGIECYYGIFSRKDNQKWLDIASEKKWLISGGSDFHGDSKPQNRLGSSFVDYETFTKIFPLSID